MRDLCRPLRVAKCRSQSPLSGLLIGADRPTATDRDRPCGSKCASFLPAIAAGRRTALPRRRHRRPLLDNDLRNGIAARRVLGVDDKQMRKPTAAVHAVAWPAPLKTPSLLIHSESDSFIHSFIHSLAHSLTNCIFLNKGGLCSTTVSTYYYYTT